MNGWRGRIVLSLMMATPASAAAQSVIFGVVHDSAGAPIVGAVVAVSAINRSTETDAKGAFRLENVLVGMRMLSVRRIGYSPFSRLIAVVDGDNPIPPITLGRVVTKLDTVVTEERTLWREAPLLREMADNMKIGLGQFVLRPELERLTSLHVDRVFRQRLGLLVVTDASGHAWVASSRRRSIEQECYRLLDASGPATPHGANCLYCYPRVYLDGVPMTIRIGDVPDVNQLLPEHLEAIEMYASPAQTPARYSGVNSQCGVIVFHSRRPPGPNDTEYEFDQGDWRANNGE